MSTTYQQVLHGEKNLATDDARPLDMNAMWVSQCARIRFTKMDTKSGVFKLITKVPMCGFENLSITVFQNEAVTVCPASDGAVTNPT